MLTLQTLNEIFFKRYIIIPFYLFLILTKCYDTNFVKSSELLTENVINASGIDFFSNTILELNYGWQYYPGILLVDFPHKDWKENNKNSHYKYPEIRENCKLYLSNKKKEIDPLCNGHTLMDSSIEKIFNLKYQKLVSSHHEWISEVDENGIPKQKLGTAVYVADLILPPGNYEIFEENKVCSSSCRLWVYEDGGFTLLQNVGYPSFTKETTRAMWLGVNRGFSTKTSNIKIILEVANFHHRSGSLGYSLNISDLNNKNYLFFYYLLDAVIFGFIFMVGAYNLILFFLKPDQKPSLFIALFCFVINLRIILVERIYQYLNPLNDSFSLLLKLQYLTFTLAPLLMVYYYYYILGKDVIKIIFWITNIYILFISSFIIFTPSEIFSNYYSAALLCVIITIIYGFIELMRKINSKDKEIRKVSRIILLFSLIFSIFVINDILMSLGIIQSIDLSAYGLAIFTFGQGIIIAIINTNQWKKAEDLSEKLSVTNQNLDKIVKDRTIALQNLIKDRNEDLNLARQIQMSMMVSEKNFQDFPIDISVYYKPLYEVGGDFYDIYQVSRKRIRFLLADATGHGVQGGLVTMLIKSEYDNIKFLSDDCNYILQLLNQRFYEKYHIMNIIFSCVILDIDFESNEILFSSAGHPNQILYQQGKILTLQRTGPIIGFIKDYSYKLHKIPFTKGDRIFLYTDGLIEQMNSKNEIFGEENLLKNYVQIQFQKMESFNENLIQSINQWKDFKNNLDDVTFIHIQRIQ